MATRVRDWQDASGGPEPAVRVDAPVEGVTPAVIDEAFESVVKEYGLSRDVAGALARLMSADHTSGVAHAYYGGLASKGLRMAQVSAMRKAMVIPYSLTEPQMAALVAYAPDFRLSFKGAASHDHPVNAAQRTIDQVICESRVPRGLRLTDIGGSVLHHARSGHLNWHCCNPLLDRKDLARHVLTNLEIRKLAADETADAAAREYAQMCIARDPRVNCGKTAQQCSYPADAAIAVHVYDIPMSAWAGIMESKGLRLVEGCILYSDVLLENRYGEFPTAGIRYECDALSDRYSMGFVDSPAWWYEHSLKEHLRYGVDQVLCGKKATYSYKIVERRADTIFFRIIRVGGAVVPDVKQVFKLPGVEMVTVKGLEISSAGASQRVPTEWNWPLPLWNAMVSSAADSYERGNFSVENQFNRYRSIAPRQTINAVHVSGGYTAPIGERVALVMYSTLEAIVQVARQRQTFAAMTKTQNTARNFQAASGFVKILMSLSSLSDGVHRWVCASLSKVKEVISFRDTDYLYDAYSVAPVLRVRRVPAELVLAKSWRSSTHRAPESMGRDFRDAVLRASPADYVTAAPASAAVAGVMLDMFGSVMDVNYRDKLESVVQAAEPEAQDKVDGSVSGKSGSVTCVASDSDVTADEIANSIREAVDEVQLEGANVEASCIKFRNECLKGSEPNVSLMQRKREEMMNPDFWYVKKGLIVRSALGREGDDFSLSAVLMPVRSVTGSFMVPVRTVAYDGPSMGKHVVREHSVIDDTSFEGWVFANDSLSVYNGPEIKEALLAALKVVRPLRVVLRVDPAGGGKTTTIVRSLAKNDVVLCPVRASVEETRERIARDRPALVFPVRDRCRTIDSYLVNVLTKGRVMELKTACLRGDEAFMTRSGKWYACALLLGATTLWACGDPQQIPHVPRAVCPALYLHLRPSVKEEGWFTYRCPHDALAAFGDLYGWMARSKSSVERSLSVIPDYQAATLRPGTVLMCMYQDEKKKLVNMYKFAQVAVRIMTTHEAQGNTFKDVRLHRFLRGKNHTDVPDEFDLFQKPNYVLVAMSRHTNTFGYWSEMVQDDVHRRIAKGSVQSRINAAAQVETAGRAVEHA